MKKIIFYFIIIVSIFIIYSLTYNKKENYIVLGDGLSEGYNLYGKKDYGYCNYYVDYLKKNNLLNIYENLSNDKNNIRDIINLINTDYSVRKKLRESTIVNLSLGLNDIYYYLLLLDKDKLIDKINYIIDDYNVLLKEIKKYAKKDIVIIGIFNPISKDNKEYKKVDDVLKYMNQNLNAIAKKNRVKYLNVYNLFKYKNITFSDNYYYPDKKGYLLIYNKMIEKR